MYRLYLAGRYTLARPVSYLAMVAIGLAVMALIVVASIMNGFLEETRSFLRGTTADIVVFPKQYREAFDRERMEQVVRDHPLVVGVSARLVRPAVFKVAGRSAIALGNSRDAVATQVLVHGIDATSELQNTHFGDYLRDVEAPELAVEQVQAPFRIKLSDIDPALRYGDHPRLLMSETLMKYLGVGRGDGLELVTVPDGYDLDGQPIQPSSQTFVITGSFNTGHYSHDKSNVYIPRELFRSWAATQHQLSELYVSAGPDADLGQLKADLDLRLKRAGLDSDVETWEDRHSILLGAVKNERNILFAIFLFFLLLVCTITFSVLTMMVQQKVRDIGILSSMGAPAGGIGSIFALCGVYISTLGGLIGLGLGIVLAQHINDVKDLIEWITGIEVFDKQVYAFSEIPVHLEHSWNITIAVVTVFGAVLICLMPAFRAARLDPVEALRHE